MIRKVSFRNFKAYRSLDLELEPFTVLVGPNASGKTTLLEGLYLLCTTMAESLMSADESKRKLWAPQVQSFGINAPVEVEVCGEWKGVKGAARATSTGQVPGRDTGEPALVFKIEGEWSGKHFPPPRFPPDVVGPANQQFVYEPPLESFQAALTSTALLRFESRKLAEASYSEEPVPQVQPDGGGLASVLAYLKLSQDEVFDSIELALKQVVPAVRRIRIERAVVEQTQVRTISLDEQRHQVPEKRTLWGHQVVLDMRGAKGVLASAAGEGTLMALGLLTVLMGPSRPRLVLLDDIEMALHPAAQARLIEVLRAIQGREPDLQVVATSHSPFILNYLDPREVRLAFLAENGFARCEKLTAHPEFERWKGLMAPGEFWSTVGEEWVEKVGGAAAHE